MQTPSDPCLLLQSLWVHTSFSQLIGPCSPGVIHVLWLLHSFCLLFWGVPWAQKLQHFKYIFYFPCGNAVLIPVYHAVDLAENSNSVGHSQDLPQSSAKSWLQGFNTMLAKSTGQEICSPCPRQPSIFFLFRWTLTNYTELIFPKLNNKEWRLTIPFLPF